MDQPIPIAAVARVLSHSKSVFLTVHERPDGDALGAQLAIALMLKRMGIRAFMANADPVPERYRFMPMSGRIVSRNPAALKRLPRNFDTAVIIECASPKRAGSEGGLIRRARTVINLDHHLNNTNYGTYNVVDTSAPAVVLLADALREVLGIPLTRDMAVNFYLGIYTETGGFRYSNTTPEVLRFASRLIEAGVNPRWVGEQVYERIPLRRQKLLARALDSLEVREGVSWMSLTRREISAVKGREEDMEDFIENARALKGIQVAVFMRETPRGDVRTSFRSKSGVPVNTVAEKFGGGGHAFAAGATLTCMGLDEARRRIAAVIRAQSRGRRTA
jgi:bifunctional oligoribonuclease and PAP phosphatase NrnA